MSLAHIDRQMRFIDYLFLHQVALSVDPLQMSAKDILWPVPHPAYHPGCYGVSLCLRTVRIFLMHVLVDIAEGWLCLYVLGRLKKCHSDFI